MTPRKDGEICWNGATVAQLTCNQQVVGSSPSSSSIAETVRVRPLIRRNANYNGYQHVVS